MIKELLLVVSLFLPIASQACSGNTDYDVEFTFKTKKPQSVSFSTDILCYDNVYKKHQF